MQLTSPAFNDGGKIPDKYGYTESNVNPSLSIADVPDETVELVLIMDDPDAVEPAGKVWDHWVLYDIEPSTRSIKEDAIPRGAVEGRTDYGETTYGGPNPPDKEHTYVFTLYAVDTELGLEPGATKDQVEEVVDGHVLDKAVLKGRYSP